MDLALILLKTPAKKILVILVAVYSSNKAIHLFCYHYDASLRGSVEPGGLRPKLGHSCACAP